MAISPPPSAAARTRESVPAATASSRSRASSVSSTSSTAALPSFEALAPPRPPTTTESEETQLVVPGLQRDVRLRVDAGPGCGGIAWPAGEVLSRYLAYRHGRDPDMLRDQTIIELGSGTGLVGIVAAMLEASANVWVTDQQQLLDLMRVNAKLNLPGHSNIHIAELDWGEPIPEEIPAKQANLILAADCVYFEAGPPFIIYPAFPLLVKTLCDLAPLGNAVEVLFCWKKRRKADKRFFALLRKHFDQEVVMDDKDGEKERYGRDGVSLLRLVRRR